MFFKIMRCYMKLFKEWHGLKVQLDIWHFTRRLAGGCTTEYHPLYATFMSRLSGCIYEWEPHDMETPHECQTRGVDGCRYLKIIRFSCQEGDHQKRDGPALVGGGPEGQQKQRGTWPLTVTCNGYLGCTSV